jgi:hypothetical protein
MDIAYTFTVVLENGETHQAEIIELPEAERLSESEFRRFTAVYKDLGSKRVINYLETEGDSVITGSNDYVINFYPDQQSIETYYYYLIPEFGSEQIEFETERNENNDITAYNLYYKTIKARFFVNDNIKETWLQDIPKVDWDSSNYYIRVNGTFYNSLKTPTIEEIDSELINLNILDITFYYEKTEYLPLLSDTVEIKAEKSYIQFDGTIPSTKYYTILEPRLGFTDYRVTENEASGLKKVSSQFGENTITIRLHLTDAQAVELKRYAPIGDAFIVSDSIQYDQIEIPVIEEIENNISDLRVFDVTLKYEQQTNYPNA